MKLLFTFSLAIFIIANLSAATWTVDNSAGAGAQFSSLASAHNSVSDGDTLLIHASSKTYGDFTISKKLVLIGPGFFAHDGRSANIGVIKLRNGATGTVITGFKINRINVELYHHVDSISIIRNHISSNGSVIVGGHGNGWGSIGESDDWLIEGNVIIEQSGCGGCTFINVQLSSNGNDNWVFRNNFIQSKTNQHNTYLLDDLNSTTLFYHNVIVFAHNGNPFRDSEGAIFQNNVIFVRNGSWPDFDSTCTNCYFDYNLLYYPNTTASDLNGSNNLIDVAPQFVDVSNPNLPLWNFDHNYRIQTGAPASTGASDGGPLGVYGGGYPFHMNGFPAAFPHVDELILENVIIQQGSDLRFKVKATGGIK